MGLFRDEPILDPAEPMPMDAAPVIHSAQWVNSDHVAAQLIVSLPGQTEPVPYILNGTDPFSYSPVLRVELERMVAAGELEILAPAAEWE